MIRRRKKPLLIMLTLNKKKKPSKLIHYMFKLRPPCILDAKEFHSLATQNLNYLHKMSTLIRKNCIFVLLPITLNLNPQLLLKCFRIRPSSKFQIYLLTQDWLFKLFFCLKHFHLHLHKEIFLIDKVLFMDL